ncbi:Uncharacterized protein F52C9.5 [Toxocara canis]|uniref:Uncharacterized protein F52C9.5 n=1 Tax=Toxocara canis TaxID=6265 RepID=A0A0B2V7G5_TOXCA|nr:Uncharacterized protein F52C9.5 [Toxocara canis]
MTTPLCLLDHHMIILSSFAALISYSLQVDAFICVEPNVTTYLKWKGQTMKDDEASKVVDSVTLHECSSLCTESSDCGSFQYESTTMQCALSSTTVVSSATATLLPDAVSESSFFQKICIPTSAPCPSPFAFERYSHHLLVGNALQVIQTAELSKCLALCLEAKKALQIECRSVMYYYGTNECILNRENRLSQPHLFINDTSSLQNADYFDNSCFDISCPEGWSVHWIKVEPFAISDRSDIILEDVTEEECSKNCLQNSVRDHRFPCKVFAYSKSKSRCHLSAESGFLNRETVTNEFHRKVSQITSEENYYEKICLHGTPTCDNISFQYTPNHALVEASPSQVLSTLSVAKCLEACLKQRAHCSAAMFFQEKDECVLTAKSQFTNPDQFRFHLEVDYFDNLCKYAKKLKKSEEMIDEFPSVLVMRQPMKVQLPRRAHASPKVIVEHNAVLSSEQLVPFDKGNLETDCRVNGIAVTMHFASRTTGSIYIKDHFSTCRTDFENTTSAVLNIELPSLRDDNPSCPAQEIKPSVWSFVIVVQKNDLDAPALITDTDRVFSASCDYSNVDIGAARAAVKLSAEEPNAIRLDETKPERIRMTILRDGQPVSSVVLGEELELRWTIIRTEDEDEDEFDFLVADCFAERLDGSPPYPPSLQLISNGCVSRKVQHRLLLYPITETKDGFSTKIKAFKFDGSRRVRIKCAIDICEEERCRQAICKAENDEIVPENESTKHQILRGIDRTTRATWVKREVLQRVKRTSLMGTLTVVEKPENYYSNEEVSSEPLQNFDKLTRSLTECNCSSQGYVCIVRSVFVLLITALTIMSAFQIYQILRHVYAYSSVKQSSSSEISSQCCDGSVIDFVARALSETGTRTISSTSSSDGNESSASFANKTRSIPMQSHEKPLDRRLHFPSNQSARHQRLAVTGQRNAKTHKPFIDDD